MAQQVRASSVMIMIIKIMNMIFSAQHRRTSNSRAGSCADANGSLGERWAVEEECCKNIYSEIVITFIAMPDQFVFMIFWRNNATAD